MASKTITITAANELELEAKIQVLQDVAKLAPDHRGRIHELSKNNAALNMLRDNWAFLKGMIPK